jgi:hypothetical protein
MRKIALILLFFIAVAATLSFLPESQAAENNGCWIMIGEKVVGCGGSGNDCYYYIPPV